jgi:DNA-binding XRE family transcriptional regulator
MAILTERRVWRRELKPPRATSPANRLTPEQQQNVMAALRVLYVRHGTWRDVGKAMGLSKAVMARIAKGTDKPSAGIALRAAALAEVPVEDVLSGKFGKPEVCPMCGKSID